MVLNISRGGWAIILFWILLTGFNLFKAFHIDDTFHLEAAQWIKDNWSRPMSGTINWLDVPEPMYHFNQPPLFFFLIAFCMQVFGENEVMLHILISGFVLLSLYYFHTLTKLLQIKQRNYFLSLFALCPAFIINQNLMTDIPLLSFVLGFVVYLLKAGSADKAGNYLIAGLLLGTGLLIKYSVLPLVVVFLMVLLVRKDYRYLWVMTIPVGMLALWSGWNIWEYGSIHFFDRPKGGLHINKLWGFLACTGSLSVFSIAFVRSVFPKLLAFGILGIALIGSALLVSGFFLNFLSETRIADILNVFFVMNGLFVGLVIIWYFLQNVKRSSFAKYVTSDAMVIALCIGATSVFMFLLAPFMATRHLLLILPFIILFGHEIIERSGQAFKTITLAGTASLGLLLGISDWLYADYYRDMAATVKVEGNHRVWTAGHWGWQWYAGKQGLLSYHKDNKNVQTGDYLIYPADISRQKFADELQLRIIDKKWREASIWTYVSGKNFASLYNSSVKNPPWTLSRMPIDTVYICRVEK